MQRIAWCAAIENLAKSMSKQIKGKQRESKDMNKETFYSQVAQEVFLLNHELSIRLRMWSTDQVESRLLKDCGLPKDIINLMRKIDARMLLIGKAPQFSIFTETE